MSYFSRPIVTMVAAAILFGSNACAATPIPYPDALAAAAVSESKISDIRSLGLVVGNGELNAIVYSVDNDLHLRISKNDCWDMRIFTQDDPPLPVVDVAAGTAVGAHGNAGSWNHPYPTALPVAEVVLGADGQTEVTGATLDLARAVATIKTAQETAEVRVLAQSNVILIHSKRPVSFLGDQDLLRDKKTQPKSAPIETKTPQPESVPIKAKKPRPKSVPIETWVSKADEGEQGGYRYLHQNIPGDEDASGMDLYVVAGRKGDLQAIAVTTSRDSAHPLADAVALVSSTLNDADAVARHEAAWQDFWSKSGVELGDKQVQNWWYRMLYFDRTFARGNGNVVGLAACFPGLAGWHNSLKLNYNIQQTYLCAAPLNHPELVEPFIDALNRNLPRAEWFARTCFTGAEGAFFHSDIWPFEPDPTACKTNLKHQQAYMPYGYTWGMDGHTAVVLWDYYKSAPTPAHLDRVYPLIRDFGTFYCSLLEKCQLIDGKRKMGPSFFPELGKYDEFNVCYDISYVTAGLRIAREAATLKNDAALLKRIDSIIDQVPTYGTQPDPEQNGQTVIEPWLGAKFNVGADRHGTMVQGIFPAGIINWFSSPDLKALGVRTINRVERSTTHANSNVTINVCRARLGLGDEAIANAKMCFSPDSKYSKELPNGLFYWAGHGFYISEQVAVARFVNELLLQSVADIIRIFPAWPSGTDARFSNLLAYGGFEVSAEQTGGKIGNVRITSTVGGLVKMVSPWGNPFRVVPQGGGESVPVTTSNGISSFATGAGQTYRLERVD
jgi:hypothetical protein